MEIVVKKQKKPFAKVLKKQSRGRKVNFIKATIFVAAFFVLPLYSAFFEISSKT